MPEPAIGQVTTNSPNSADDSNIHEGLGSLNRWSQSTASSNLSPNYGNHRRQESVPRVFTADIYDSHRRGLSLETNTLTHLPSQITSAPGGERSQNQYPHQTVFASSHMETPTLDRPETGVLPSFSNNVAAAPSSQPDTLPSGVNPTPPDSRSKRRSPETEPFRQTAGYPGNTLVEPNSQNEKRRQGHSQKAMLSKALQKANTAVLLDNAANFEGAMEAYNDACQLLQLVMLWSNGGEDEKLKLQEIRDTYMIRVTELQRMDFAFRDVDSKALPERPLSQESYGEYFHPIHEDSDRDAAGDDLQQYISGHPQPVPEESRSFTQGQIPPRRQSLLPSAFDDSSHNPAFAFIPKSQTDQSRLESCGQDPHHAHENSVAAPTLPENLTLEEEENVLYDSRFSELSVSSTQGRDTHESTSWLDTIDESGASSSASVHSKASSIYLRRRRSSHLSHFTEAEFDAALDAAVEAAYDEGLEPESESPDYDGNDDVLTNARRNVELAKQKVREAEREVEVAMTRGRELRRIQGQEILENSNDPESDYLDEEAEEEERLLEEMTRGYVMDDFEFDLQYKSALPRQSGSDAIPSRMWENSISQNPMMGGGKLSTLIEDDVLPPDSSTSPHTRDSSSSVSAQPATKSTPGPSVRARRMSGQNAMELKIETNPRLKSGTDGVEDAQSSDVPMQRPPTPLEKDELPVKNAIHATKSTGATAVLHANVHSNRRNMSIGSIAGDMSTNLNLARTATNVEDDDATKASQISSPPRRIGKMPSAPDNLGRPNPGIAPFRARNVSVPGHDFFVDSPETPSTSAFPTLDIQKEVSTAPINALPTPTAANFVPTGLSNDALYSFDSYIHSPINVGYPNTLAPNPPLPLEPCPESFLLRPFWLMRCIYQTIAHPRGGYLSTKLFIPRDVWRVKNVKIKGVDEKVSNCDLLTAALLKLSKVDTYDADAVLEEMQTFESVLDQAQMSLSKKIGNEVGVQGAMPLFKAAQTLDDITPVEAVPLRSSNGPSKSYLSSWRKLRSKNSGFGVGALASSKEANKDHLTISSLPMTSSPNAQPIKRNIAQVQFGGPNANYMSALARLCDAAQVLDQIAQQVEDPGLRHSSQTLVGLELSTRHAAEFFGFYICRFALNDIGIMLDKFIKRGSEWALI